MPTINVPTIEAATLALDSALSRTCGNMSGYERVRDAIRDLIAAMTAPRVEPQTVQPQPLPAREVTANAGVFEDGVRRVIEVPVLITGHGPDAKVELKAERELREARDAVYALDAGPVEQVKHIPLADYVKTRFIRIDGQGGHNEIVGRLQQQLADAEARVGKAKAVIAQHNLCHDLHGKVNADDFAKGCEAEQKRIYGRSPTEDTIASLRQQVETLTARLSAIEGVPSDNELPGMWSHADFMGGAPDVVRGPNLPQHPTSPDASGQEAKGDARGPTHIDAGGRREKEMAKRSDKSMLGEPDRKAVDAERRVVEAARNSEVGGV
jgi:hypothetical protein